MHNVIHRRNTCRSCDSNDLDLVLSLKPSPIGDAYVTSEKLNVNQPNYPIDLYMCKNCGLAQLVDIIDPNILYGDYIYVTGSSHGLLEHFNSSVKSIMSRCKLKEGSLIVDIGSNDGTLLSLFQQRGMNVLGIEPASHIASQASSKGIETIDKFFSPELANQIINDYGPAKLITANNVFANIDDLKSWIIAIKNLLDSDGIFVFESYYLADVLQNMVFDFIYHEHLSSFSVKPVLSLFQRFGLELIAIEKIPTKGGSLRYFIQRPGGPLIKDDSVIKMIASEERIRLYQKDTFVAFAKKINYLKEKTRDFLSKVRSEGKSIAAFGASITGTTLIYHFEIGEYLDYLVDDNPAKQGRFSPGLHLPVFPSLSLCEKKPDYVIILAWRFAETIINKNQAYIENGGQFIIPSPEFKICARKL